MSWRSSSAGVDERERQGAHHLTHGGRRRPMGETGAALPLRASPQSASETRSSSSSADCAASPAPAGRVGTSAVSADARHSEGSTGKFTLHRSPRPPAPSRSGDEGGESRSSCPRRRKAHYCAASSSAKRAVGCRASGGALCSAPARDQCEQRRALCTVCSARGQKGG